MNTVCLQGNLGQDPVLNHTKTGTSVLNLRLATKERRRVGEQWESYTEWHSVAVWGKRAEALARYLHKGSSIALVGKLSTKSYEDREGVKRYRTEVVASDVEFSGSRERTDEPRQERRREPERQDDTEDIPF